MHDGHFKVALPAGEWCLGHWIKCKNVLKVALLPFLNSYLPLTEVK